MVGKLRLEDTVHDRSTMSDQTQTKAPTAPGTKLIDPARSACLGFDVDTGVVEECVWIEMRWMKKVSLEIKILNRR